MIITLKKNTPQEEIQKMIEALESKNDVDVKLSTKEGNALSIDSVNGGLYVSVPDDTTKIDKKH